MSEDPHPYDYCECHNERGEEMSADNQENDGVLRNMDTSDISKQGKNKNLEHLNYFEDEIEAKDATIKELEQQLRTEKAYSSLQYDEKEFLKKQLEEKDELLETMRDYLTNIAENPHAALNNMEPNALCNGDDADCGCAMIIAMKALDLLNKALPKKEKDSKGE